MLDLRVLRDKWTEDGARSVFAELVTQCVRSTYPDAQAVRPDPGDEGLDTFVGDFQGDLRVYQAKYFCDEIGDAQKSQIRDSWKRCRDSAQFSKIRSWTLCVPIDLSVPEHKWWQTWAKKQAEQTGCHMNLWSKSKFVAFQAKPDLTSLFEVALGRVGSFASAEQVIGELKRAATARPLEALPSEDHLKDAIFVKKLEAAGWRRHRHARTAFYNFELLRFAIEEGGTPSEVAALRDLRERVHGVWETAFNEHAPDKLGAAFVAEVERRIVAAHQQFLRSSLPAGEVHKVGAIHDWADHCHAGWIENFSLPFDQGGV